MPEAEAQAASYQFIHQIIEEKPYGSVIVRFGALGQLEMVRHLF
jgi:hypothetical protein